ncbi:MAG: TolB family protein, partial [Blastocatellia bacterium]
TTGRREIWKVPAAGGDPVQVTREGGAYGIESPDGAWLYFRKGRHSPGIWRIPVRGGSESFFYKLPSPRYSRAWDVTREGLVYAYAAPAENQIRVEMIRIADRSVRQLASLRGTLSEGYGGLSVSSDAGWMILPIHKSLRGDIVTARFFIP